MAEKLPEEFLKRIEAVTNKRARIVLDQIAKSGRITTEELKLLGYEHPPRARMDALDLGFPIVTTMVKNSAGKSIAAYSFDLTKALGDKSRMGRVALPKRAREGVLEAAGRKCQLCGGTHDLQVDHRVPYQVAGESLKSEKNPYMVLDGTCNRRKSWVCEHCTNFLDLKEVDVCLSCYWAYPEEHTHAAMEPIRRVDVVFQGEQTKGFDKFREVSRAKGKTVDVALKDLIIKSGK